MKLEEAISRLRTCAQLVIDRKSVKLTRIDHPHTQRKLKEQIKQLEEARRVAAEFIEIMRDRDWTGKWK